MRVCSNSKLDKAGFARFLSLGGWCKRWIVTVNGVAVPHAMLADDEEGIVVAFKTDDAGAYLPNADRTDLETYQLRGDVEIVILPKTDTLDAQ